MIKGVSKDSLKYIVGQIRRIEVDSIKDFQRTASILAAYDQFSDPKEELANQFIIQNQKIAYNNLSIKQILEDVIDGTNITSLMEVEKEPSGNRQRYEWETKNLPHADILQQLRELGNSMYKQIDVPFVETVEYEQMRGIVRRCHDDDKSQKLFKFWESIVETEPSDVVASTPLELAKEIFAYVKKEGSISNSILHGVRALLYIDQQNPTPEQAEVVRNYASYFIDNIPEGTRKTGRLSKTLIEARAYSGVEAQEVVA